MAEELWAMAFGVGCGLCFGLELARRAYKDVTRRLVDMNAQYDRLIQSAEIQRLRKEGK